MRNDSSFHGLVSRPNPSDLRCPDYQSPMLLRGDGTDGDSLLHSRRYPPAFVIEARTPTPCVHTRSDPERAPEAQPEVFAAPFPSDRSWSNPRLQPKTAFSKGEVQTEKSPTSDRGREGKPLKGSPAPATPSEKTFFLKLMYRKSVILAW